MGPNKLTLPPNINLWPNQKNSPNQKKFSPTKNKNSSNIKKLTQTTIRNLYIFKINLAFVPQKNINLWPALGTQKKKSNKT